MTAAPAAPSLCTVLAFNASNQLAVRQGGGQLEPAFTGDSLAAATARLETAFPKHTVVTEYFTANAAAGGCRVFFTQVGADSRERDARFYSLDELAAPARARMTFSSSHSGLDPYTPSAAT